MIKYLTYDAITRHRPASLEMNKWSRLRLPETQRLTSSREFTVGTFEI
jgi:hypothetical protein